MAVSRAREYGLVPLRIVRLGRLVFQYISGTDPARPVYRGIVLHRVSPWRIASLSSADVERRNVRNGLMQSTPVMVRSAEGM